MIELKKCCSVPFPEKLFEEYEIADNKIFANIGASKVLDMMKRFSDMRDEPMFFILEVPATIYDGITESKILHNSPDNNDVYYIDGLDNSGIKELLDAVGNFLVKDGMNLFGIAGHISHEEIVFGRYNLMTIHTPDPQKYKDFFAEFEIKVTDHLVTAWDTFDENNAGECTLLVSEVTGKTIYDIPEVYKDYGMYLYEERKEYDEGEEHPITYDELIGKILLVGITYCTKDEEPIEQKQFYGRVTEANDLLVRIKQNSGEEFDLPPDLSSTKRARPGEYKLRSTGEIVLNPDFFATWTCTRDDEEN